MTGTVKHDYRELMILAGEAEVITLPKPEIRDKGIEDDKDLVFHKQICESIGLVVVGSLADRKIKIFSRDRGHCWVISQLNRLTYTDLLQICGPSIAAKVHRSEEPIPGLLSVQQIRDSIAVWGGSEMAGEGHEVGIGVWQGKPTDDCPVAPLVLVGAGEAATWIHGTLEKVCDPRIGGLKVDLDAARDAQWYNLPQLQEYLAAAIDRRWCVNVVDDVVAILDQWYWRNNTERVVPEIVTALLIATWVQSLWQWRPMVALTGASDSGKTTLFEFFGTMFGPLTLLSSKSTEAGIRQAVASSSKVILCDEFEQSKDRAKILEFFRTASQGSLTYRGTTAQVSRGYGLQHIVWVAATEVGMKRAPDRNRYIWLELDEPPKEKRGTLVLPSHAELEDFGQKLLAIGLRHAVRADAVARSIIRRPYEGIHGRVVENFAVPVAILGVLAGQASETAAQGLLYNILGRMETDPSQSTRDESSLLGEICSSTIRLGKGQEATVGEALNKVGLYDSDEEKALQRSGIAVLGPNGVNRDATTWYPKWLFIATNPVLRYVLKGTDWERQDIAQILKRFEGAEKVQAIVGGHRPWGIRIPWSKIEGYINTPEDSDTQESAKF